MNTQLDQTLYFSLAQIKQYFLKIKLFIYSIMYTPRPKSASKVTCTHEKPLMQVKYKQRSGSRSVLNDSRYQAQSFLLPQAKQNPQKYQIPQKVSTKQKSLDKRKIKQQDKKNRSNSVIIESKKNNFDEFQQEKFRDTSCKLFKQNFKHHDPQLCVCQHCTCGRHLCKLHAVAPNLSKISTYAKDFYKKSATPSKVVIAEQYGKLQGPHLQMNSTYLKDYPGKTNDDLSRLKPEDLLKTGGPCANLTSYSTGYPGHKGPNQYVKPTDKHRREKFPLRGKSTYKTAFLGEQKDQQNYNPYDNLKPGTGWFGSSTYDNAFKTPRKDNYPVHVKFVEKRQLNPDYKFQYETTYGNDFINPGSGVCPSKIILQAKRKGQFRDSKIKFMQNSDFKSLSPQFRSYSANRAH